ncbi:MAG: adenine phosphoribosyltransferase [Ruminococcaceae bacterium]|nr:adenine phosphoribosyltransferase [Oscillospiraceae bacterium]
MENKVYTMEIAGLKRDLPLCKVSDELYIAGFVMFGDVEITVACARELLKLAPEYDIMITAESKGIPLIYEMARQSGADNYILARKGPKVYMGEVVTVTVNSITTLSQQMLCLGKADADAMRGKRVLIVDDVISTGASLAALTKLVEECGGNIVGKMAVLAEGDAIERKDIIALAPLPVFNPDGTVKE